MSNHIAHQIAQAYQQTPVWALNLPADAAAGVASAALAPLTAEVTRHAGATAPKADKRAAYTQVVVELRRTATQAEESRKLGPSERLAFGGFVQVLLQHYERQLDAI